LHGRRKEHEELERLLETVRGGKSRVLVMSREPEVRETAAGRGGGPFLHRLAFDGPKVFID
jgi:hypothetical protein